MLTGVLLQNPNRNGQAFYDKIYTLVRTGRWTLIAYKLIKILQQQTVLQVNWLTTSKTQNKKMTSALQTKNKKLTILY